VEKLDLKDRKILYHLDLDSRQSFSQLGKKVGLHKDVVAYRVKKLQEKGIIEFFKTEYNEYKLGFCYLRFYLTYQYATAEIKKEIIDFFVKNKYTIAVHSLEGSFNLVILVAVKNIPKFFYTWEKVLGKYRDYFANQVFSIICEHILYKYTFLLNGTKNECNDRIFCRRYDDGKKVKLDELDNQIIKLLDDNARIPTIEMANKLNSTAATINHRIKNLIKIGIILGFRLNIDFTKLGYNWYRADVIFKQRDNIQKIINYIQANPNFISLSKSLGYVDLELNFFLQDVNRLHKFMENLTIKFPDAIKSYTYFSITKSHKWVYMPEE
jgi:Lrp/AsnC family transcriptional regulator for asnA, asnC and gidA